jgi:hypothetical protein
MSMCPKKLNFYKYVVHYVEQLQSPLQRVPEFSKKCSIGRFDRFKLRKILKFGLEQIFDRILKQDPKIY